MRAACIPDCQIMRNADNYKVYYANSCKRATVLFHFTGLLLISNFPLSEMLAHRCNNASTYIHGSTFSSNLNKVMGDLLKNGPQTGFNTSSYGQSPNRIYGLLQCKGNISWQSCSNCLKQANDSLRQLCENNVGGLVWLDLCFLRYENYTFFSKLDTNGIYEQNIKFISTSTLNNLTNFVTTTFDLLSKLLDEAYAPGNKGFAKGSAAVSFNGTVYGLVQCWRDLSIKDCRSCLQFAMLKLYKCCSTHQGARVLLGSCTTRYEIYPFFNTSGMSNYTTTGPPASSGSSTAKPSAGPAQTPSVNVASPTTSKGSTKTIPILGIVGGVFLTLAICLFALRRKLKSAITLTCAQNEEIHDPQSTLLRQKQILFTLEALMVSTDNFHESNKLGRGGFGSVYKGKTRDRKEIAVKKLSVNSSQGNEEFMNEVEALGNVRHRNLVKLLGCCAEGPERLIVYEYLPNKSLHALLFDPDHQKRKLLDWQTRYKIIMGIACGLRYLHDESEPRIIHRDIKATNILLDQTLNSKIADFGLARLFPEDESYIQTTKVAGTFGYMAPEYAMRGQLSMKADIYSFGVLVIEIVSGRKISDTDLPQEIQSLLEWAWVLYKQGRLLSMVDSTISETCRQEEAVRCIHVALLCTQPDAGNRPTIATVILMISSSSGTSLPNPQKPVFLENSENNEGGSTARRTDESRTYSASPAHTPGRLVPSINDVTITELESR